MRHKLKYCPQAKAMIRTLKRGETRGWQNLAATVAALSKHVDRCPDGCGRDLEGEQWPPP